MTEVAARKAGIWTKLAYGAGAAANGIKNNGFEYFLLFYYSQVLGVDSALVGATLMIAMFVDGITDPIVGYWSDNLKTKLGRRHPFMYGAIIPVAVAYVFAWNPPEGMTGNALFPYLLMITILVRIAYTFYEVPSSALVAELTDDYDERASFLSICLWLDGRRSDRRLHANVPSRRDRDLWERISECRRLPCLWLGCGGCNRNFNASLRRRNASPNSESSKTAGRRPDNAEAHFFRDWREPLKQVLSRPVRRGSIWLYGGWRGGFAELLHQRLFLGVHARADRASHSICLCLRRFGFGARALDFEAARQKERGNYCWCNRVLRCANARDFKAYWRDATQW